MGNCRYCGKPAGFLRSSHPTCDALRKTGLAEIPRRFDAYLDNPVKASDLKAEVTDLARTHLISDAELTRMAIAGLDDLVNDSLQDHLLTEEEESRIEDVRREFDFTPEESRTARHRLVKAKVLRDLDNGIVRNRLGGAGIPLPVILKRGEELLWVFNDVTFFQHRKKTHYIGRSHGVSLRVMRGVYLSHRRFPWRASNY
jgi:hypothetical protein